MRICRIELRNFRGIQYGCVNLPKHGVLLGANNAGKSTIVEAITLLFGREKMVRPISEWDFYGGLPKPDSRFYIIATITDFAENDPLSIPDWFVGEHAARPVWWHEDSLSLSTEADPPPGTLLAAQVAIAGRYEEEVCEFETVRYFYYGDEDPFTDGFVPIPARLLREVGVFLLSSNREWDKLLSFSSSSLLKVIREYGALPGKVIEDLKIQLRSNVPKIEETSPLLDILSTAEKELQSFLLISKSSKMVYRPTSLDSISVLQSLIAHIAKSDDSLIPVARHGAGMISLQAFLLLLAFARQRKNTGQNFILAAEEPELHLHPSLHQLLVNKIRSASVQSIVTTQSPSVAAGYQPHEAVFIQNTNGELKATPLRTEPIKAIATNSVRNLYLIRRDEYYEALMGGIILVPEGIYDYEWLNLWQRVAQSAPDLDSCIELRPITIVPTSDAAIVETFQDICRFKPEAIPIVDGDMPGAEYLSRLSSITPAPSKIVRYGNNAAIECLSAWILEPALTNPGNALQRILPDPNNRTLKNLQDALIANKKERELRENLAWESISVADCCNRSREFFHDLAAIALGDNMKNANWSTEIRSDGSTIFTATHIRRP